MFRRTRLRLSRRAGPHGARVAGAPRNAARDEAGAVLILALVFLVAASLVVTALVSWSGNDLKNTVNFKNGRSLQYAVAGATQLEIQALRYTFTPAAATYGCTPGGAPSIQLDGRSVSVYCSVVLAPSSASTRVVTLDACVSSESMATCAGNPYLQAVIVFDDYSTADAHFCTSLSNEATCGRAVTVRSWIVK